MNLKIGILIISLLFLVSKGYSQLLSGKSNSFFHSIQVKSENYNIPEYGLLKLSKDNISWQIKLGYGIFNIDESTRLLLLQSNGPSLNFNVIEDGSSFFVKPGIVFYISKNHLRKRNLLLGALNLHSGLSFYHLEIRSFDAVYGNINKQYDETKPNLALEFECIHILELFDRVGTRMGIHAGVKVINKNSFEGILPLQGEYSQYYTPGLGKGAANYLGFSFGIIFR